LHCNAALKEATTQKEMNAKWGSHVQSWQSRAQFACMGAKLIPAHGSNNHCSADVVVFIGQARNLRFDLVTWIALMKTNCPLGD
jgi:hypothetical protein